MQKQKKLANLKNEVGTKVNIFYMLRKVALSVKARAWGQGAFWSNRGCQKWAIPKRVTPKTQGYKSPSKPSPPLPPQKKLSYYSTMVGLFVVKAQQWWHAQCTTNKFFSYHYFSRVPTILLCWTVISNIKKKTFQMFCDK